MARDAWCPHCKRITKFISHADYEDRWVCTTRGCFHRCRKKELKDKQVVKRYY